MAIKIFLSHSAADESLASALVDCLMSCMVLEDEEVRCTSVAGHKLPVGSDFAATLIDDIGESSVVIGLITQNAIRSSWVMFELGATWGSKKNMKPLVSSEVDLKMLPGPVSGRHIAKLTDASDIAQFIEETTQLIAAKSRSAGKIAKAIDTFLDAHKKHLAKEPSVFKVKEPPKTKELNFSGVPFSELVKILQNETIKIPSTYNQGKGDTTANLLSLFYLNFTTFTNGLRSDHDKDTPGSFLYYEVALKLIPFGLVSFDKLPASQAKWFKRLSVSNEGNKFYLECKRSKVEL